MASLWMKSINSPNFILPISFNSAIRQILTRRYTVALIVILVISTFAYVFWQ